MTSAKMSVNNEMADKINNTKSECFDAIWTNVLIVAILCGIGDDNIAAQWCNNGYANVFNIVQGKSMDEKVISSINSGFYFAGGAGGMPHKCLDITDRDKYSPEYYRH